MQGETYDQVITRGGGGRGLMGAGGAGLMEAGGDGRTIAELMVDKVTWTRHN